MMFGHDHAAQGSHGLALASCGNNHRFVLIELIQIFQFHQHTIGNIKVAQFPEATSIVLIMLRPVMLT